jgi:arylsulfatase A-like enzyme
MHIPLTVHFPAGVGAGKRFDNLVYNVDATATSYDYSEVDISKIDLDGKSLKPIVCDNQYNAREYLTCRYGDTVWYRDREHWVIIDVSSKPRAVFDFRNDRNCRNNILDTSSEVVDKAWNLILQDAGGQLPIYDMAKMTDAVGRRR